MSDEKDEEYKASRESDDDEEEDEEGEEKTMMMKSKTSKAHFLLLFKKAKKKTKSKNGKEKSEAGVGAHVEFAQYIDQSSESISSWKENTATPFGIVADTFESIAEQQI